MTRRRGPRRANSHTHRNLLGRIHTLVCILLVLVLLMLLVWQLMLMLRMLLLMLMLMLHPIMLLLHTLKHLLLSIALLKSGRRRSLEAEEVNVQTRI